MIIKQACPNNIQPKLITLTALSTSRGSFFPFLSLLVDKRIFPLTFKEKHKSILKNLPLLLFSFEYISAIVLIITKNITNAINANISIASVVYFS